MSSQPSLTSQPEIYDVIVIGSGNAGFSSALSASEAGARRVLLLEKAPAAWAGGNSTFTAGAYRTVFSSLSSLLPLVSNVPADLASRIDMAPYTAADFHADLFRVTGGRADKDLANVLVDRSWETTRWLARQGVPFQLSFHRQAYEIAGRFKFWGGMVLAVADGGKGLTRAHQAAAQRAGIEVRYEAPVTSLLLSSMGAVTGVTVAPARGEPVYDVHASGGVVLAAGGFEASAALRAQYLGPGWDAAYVRGTPFNTGDLLTLAISQAGARTAGNWSGCHSTCWDANAPVEAGDQVLTNQFTKSGYPLGLMFNAAGARFVDEGLDLRNYTYARFGREILRQPGGVAFQLWDADGAQWLRKEEYDGEVVERVSADSLQELVRKLGDRGLTDPSMLLRNVDAYNEAVEAFRAEKPDAVFDPSKKDGLSTVSSAKFLASEQPDKTNWALPVTKPPFLAVKVACGITFTFGGLKIDPQTAGVVSARTERCIEGLYCAGEMVGGLFWENYPGGSGLTSGAVFGRIAGRHAAERAMAGKSEREKARL